MEATSSEQWSQFFLGKIKSALDNPQCPGSKDNERRIEFILRTSGPKLMGQFLSDVTVFGKNPTISSYFRGRGNVIFTSSDDMKLNKAVEEYTKSVTHAPIRSQELALAYANRSAVLFEARSISDCLLDIERALKNNYPDNLKAKLYLRKAMCLQILKPRNDSTIKTAFIEAWKWVKEMDGEKQKIMEEMLTEQENVTSINKFTFSKWDGKKFFPKLSAENPTIPGLSDAVELQYSEKYGRHMIATRDIKPGELLAIQKPYCSVVQLNSRYFFCGNCGEQTWASIPCDRCVEVVYCSENCKSRAMLEHHEVECPVIASLIALRCSDIDIMPLRIAIKALKEMDNSFETLRNYIEKIDAEKDLLLKGFTNNILEPNKFSSVYGLSAPEDTDTERTQLKILNSIIVAFLLATKTRYFGWKMNYDLETLSLKKDFIFVVALLEKLMKVSQSCKFQTNVQDVGCFLLVPALSFFNHSCDLPTIRLHQKRHMAIRALCPIKKGQQVFDNYGKSYDFFSKNKRQTYLSTVYNFHCDCKFCENDWQAQPAPPLEKQSGERKEAISLFTESFETCLEIVDKKNDNFDIEKDVARVASALQRFYLHFQPNSFEVSSTQRVLWNLFNSTRDRFLSLDGFYPVFNADKFSHSN